MAQQIGLEAVLDTSNFNKGMGQYLSSLNKATTETERASGSFTKSFNAMGGVVASVTAAMGTALVGAGIAAGAAIAKFTVDGIGKAKDLEAQMSNIAAVLNMTAQEAAPLKDLILELGVDPDLKVNAVEAANAIEMLARNGLSMDEIMAGAARSTVLLANATGADFSVAADIATDAMAIFKISAEEMSTAVNGITSVTNASKFTIDDYALALAQGGGVASAAGVEFTDFNTSIAAISPLFKSGSDAGTSFKTMIQRLVPQSSAAADAMAALGFEFFDAQGNMKSMAEISEELNQAFMQEVTFSTQVSNLTEEQTSRKAMLEKQMQKLNMELFKYEAGINGVAQSEEDKAVSIDRLNRQLAAAQAAYGDLAGEVGTTISVTRALTEEERNMYLTTIFGTDAMRAAIGLAESGTVVYTDLATAAKETGLSQDILNKYIEGGITQFELLEAQMSQIDAAEQAKTRMDNLAGALEILEGVFETIQIKVGEKFLPMLTDLTRSFTALVEDNEDQIIAFFDQISDWIGTNVPLAIEALVGAWPSIVAGFTTLTNMITPLVSGMMSLADIIGVGLATAFALIKDNMAAFQGALAGISILLAGSVISAGITAIATALGVLLSPLGLVIVGVAALGAAWNTNFLGMQDKTLAAIETIQGAFAPLTSSIQEFGQGALQEIGAFVSGNETDFANVKAIWAGAQESFSGIFGGLKDWLSDNLPSWQASLTEWATAASQWITDSLPSLLQNLGEWWNAILSFYTQHHPLFNGQLAEWITILWQWIVDAVPVVTAKLSTWWASISSYVTGQLPSWKATLLDWANAAWGWIVDAAGLVAGKLAQWWTSISTYVTGQLPAWKTALTAWADAAWQWIVDAAGLVATKLGEWYAKLSAYITSQLPVWQASLAGWATALWQWIVDAAGEVTAKMGEWYAKLSGYLSDNLPTWQTAFTEWATAMVTWITDAGAKAQTELTTWATDLWNHATTDLLPKFKTEMLAWATGILEWIGSADADPVVKLAEWLGKILAWIPLGVAKLAIEAGKLAGALIGWISGAGNADSLVSQTDPEMEKFKTALTGALDNIKTIFLESVKAFVTSWKDTMSEHVDWSQLGKDLMTAVKDGAASIKAALELKMQELADGAKKKFSDLVESLKQVGKDIIQGLIDGIWSMKDALFDKVKEMANLMPGWMKTFLGIESPSKVFAAIGVDVVNGLVQGIERTQRLAVKATDNLAKAMISTAERGGRSAVSAFSGIAGNLLSVGGTFADMLGENPTGNAAGAAFRFNHRQKELEFLQQQADLIDLIRESGADPAQVLAGVTLGLSADPAQILNVINTTMAQLTSQLEHSIKTAGMGFEHQIEIMRNARRSIQEVEQEANNQRLTYMERYRRDIANIDTQITRTEQEVLSGRTRNLTGLQALDQQREQILKNISLYIQQSQQMESIMAAGPEWANDRASEAAEQFIKKSITPILESFDLLSVESRAQALDSVRQMQNMLRSFSVSITAAAGVEKRALEIGEAFGKTVNNRIEQMLGAIYNPMLDSAARQKAIGDLNEFATSLTTIQARLNQMRDGATFDQIVQSVLGETTQLDRYRASIDRIDSSIANLQEQLLETGNSALFANVTTFQEQRQAIETELRAFLNQTKQLQQRMNNLPTKNLTGRAAEAAQSFLDKYVNPLVEGFDKMTVAQRDATMTRIDELLRQLATYSFTGNSLNNVERNALAVVDSFGANVQNRIKQMLDVIYNPLTAVTDRNAIIGQLNTLASDLTRIQSRIDAQSGRHKSIDDFISELIPLDQIGYYKQQISVVDKNLERLNSQLLATGDVSLLERYTALDLNRSEIEWELRKFLQQRQQFENLLTRVAEMPEIGAKAAQNFYDNQIQPLVDAFARPMTEAQRLANMALTQERITALNAYINAMERFEALKADLSSGMAGDPTMRNLTRIEQMLQNINLSEAERNRLMQEYRTEQEKLLAIQQKQQRLDFLNQQLNVVKQLESLNKDHDDIISVKNLLSGITLGMNASVDDMILLTSRAIDAMILAAQRQLGIASPSKVFEAMGNYVMQGLGRGITNAAMQPVNALRNVVSDMPYTLAQRSLTINMGGVAINNGMDEIMFEQKVRRIVNGMDV